MRILVVRRDNIGDLVCTTPLLAALRLRFPQAWIGALVNSYNAPVLEHNPDLNAVIAYTKLKHLHGGQSALGAFCGRLRSLWNLRRRRLDYIILAQTSFVERTVRLARWLAPKHLVGFSDGSRSARMLDLSVPVSQVEGKHEVERVFALAAHFGIGDNLPALKLVPDPLELQKAKRAFSGPGLKVALHISARRPAQRWPAPRLVELIRRLPSCQVMLLWSPGTAQHPQHPGDDEKADSIVEQTAVLGYRTQSLKELIGALAAADAVICSDGGASHIAAALGKPMVCLFGDSPAYRWHPWGVPHRLIQPASRDVRDISVEEVLAGLDSVAHAAC